MERSYGQVSPMGKLSLKYWWIRINAEIDALKNEQFGPTNVTVCFNKCGLLT
jgi:hypothetical protein